MNDDFLNVKELAKKLKVPISWVYDRTRKSGPDRLPHYRLGKYVRFLENEVIEHLRQKGEEVNDR